MELTRLWAIGSNRDAHGETACVHDGMPKAGNRPEILMSFRVNDKHILPIVESIAIM